ncbi:MAG: acyl-CoA thioesterase II [Actinomycetota bacterium]|nr:acyl-CoA thioesterase II [Actinomycetota bacterium]
MGAQVAELLHLLDLEAVEVNIFRGVSLDPDRIRVFGGQVAAQALVAAGRTVTRGRVHSLHSYFLRPGDPKSPILYEVDRIRDGRSFTTRRVVAIQHGEAIFNLQCSFHADEEGLEHQDRAPDVPRPETLEPSRRPAPDDGLALARYPEAYGLEVRFVTELPWDRRGEPHDKEQLWLRAASSVGDDAILHAAIVTFASDLTLVDSILQRHGISPADPALAGASLDHCMWFHRAFRADEWLLYDHRSPVAHGARGLAQGAVYDDAGIHVASVVQEGLVRIRPGAAPAARPGSPGATT